MMTEDELELAIPAALEADTFDFQNPDDEDDYISAILYRTTSGRHFRLITSSGMDSVYSGAGNIGEWLMPNEIATWTEF